MNKSFSAIAFTAIILTLAACAPAQAPAPTPTAIPPTITLPTLAPTVARAISAPATATTAPTFASTATRAASPTLTPIVLGSPPARMTRYEVVKARNPNAICNDGSPAIFFYRRGSGSGINKWVLFFKGGAACWDSGTCAGRDKGLLTSTVWTAGNLDAGGIVSERPEQNPDFFNWNQVFAVYCSSDFWSGTRPDNNNEVKLFFRGHYIVDAIVDSIMDANLIGAPTLREATQIIISGSSAGGIGVRVNLDRLAKTLTWGDVRGVDDAGVLVYTNPAYTPVEQDRIGKVMMDLWKPDLDESCLASTPARPWLCLESDYAVKGKHITTPYFIRHDLYDPVTLEWQHLDPRNQQHRPPIFSIAMQMTDILKGLPGAFGTADGEHIALESERFNHELVDSLSFAQVLGNWYFNRSGPKVVVAPLRR